MVRGEVIRFWTTILIGTNVINIGETAVVTKETMECAMGLEACIIDHVLVHNEHSVDRNCEFGGLKVFDLTATVGELVKRQCHLKKKWAMGVDGDDDIAEIDSDSSDAEFIKE
ncbi:hypothetical protein GIB67_021782 [Kingdonia uniflora]|uniref:Uncharacterized protein n=1 Tax=Kingdonia uniflora TaxID=39325 RepID=A0A7J7M9N1_9MAGN|nr:hypothetical protein GIB67_021782 [Kingdonia uniflora]